MKSQRLAISLTLINLALLAFLVVQNQNAEAQSVAPVLRGRKLEIVDSQGRNRASVTVEPPVTIDARTHPESVVLRSADPKSRPVLKMVASEEGSTIGLSAEDESGVQVSSNKRNGNFLKVVSREGKEQVVKP